MLRPEQTIERVYLHRAPIDIRKQRSGLAALVKEVHKQDPFSSAIFLFIGKRRDRIKALWRDRNGFVVWYKVIEGDEKFPWPRHLVRWVIERWNGCAHKQDVYVCVPSTYRSD